MLTEIHEQRHAICVLPFRLWLTLVDLEVVSVAFAIELFALSATCRINSAVITGCPWPGSGLNGSKKLRAAAYLSLRSITFLLGLSDACEEGIVTSFYRHSLGVLQRVKLRLVVAHLLQSNSTMRHLDRLAKFSFQKESHLLDLQGRYLCVACLFSTGVDACPPLL